MSKNVLITGAAKRVGKEIAVAFAKEGWDIAIHHHTSSPTDVVNEVESHNVKAVTVQADLNDFGQTRNVLLSANEQLGEINLLVNSASIFEKCSFNDTEHDVFNRHMNINFKAPFYLSQDFARQCKGNGHIVNICDTRIVNNKSAYFAYLLSKKSLNELTKMTAVELAPNIRVNSICIGMTTLSDELDQKYLDDRMELLPLKHKTSLDEIFESIKYLQNSKLTGQEIFLDGGEQLI